MPQSCRDTTTHTKQNDGKDIVELKGNYDLKNPNDRKNLEEKIVDLNAKLLSSINAYTKGKKSVRGTRDGQ